jgi:hypothetical protein
MHHLGNFQRSIWHTVHSSKPIFREKNNFLCRNFWPWIFFVKNKKKLWSDSIIDVYLPASEVSNYNNNIQKVVLTAKKLAPKNVRFSQNRRFKLLPVNFRYHRTSGEKSKKLVIYLSLLNNVYLNIFNARTNTLKVAHKNISLWRYCN